MSGSFYRDRLAGHGLEVVVPDPSDRQTVDDIIFEELTHGETREASRSTYLRVIDDLTGAGAEGIVLGCTDIESLAASVETDVNCATYRGEDSEDRTGLQGLAVTLSVDADDDADRPRTGPGQCFERVPGRRRLSERATETRYRVPVPTATST